MPTAETDRRPLDDTNPGPGPSRWIVSRWAAPLIALVALLACVGAILLPGAAGEASAPQSLPEEAESAQAAELLEQFPSGDSAPAVIVVTGSGDLDEATLGTIGEALPDLAEAAEVSPDTLAGPIPSQDGEAALVIVPLPSEVVDAEGPERIDALREAANSIAPDGGAARVTGPAGFAADVSSSFEGADVRLLIATAAVVAVLLLLTYRSPILWLVPLTVVGLADRAAAKLSEYTTNAADLTVDGSTAGITSVLVFGAGTNYALLLVSRYREELREHADHRRALAVAWRGALPAIAASNLTVVLTVALLALAVQPSTRALGVSSATGLLVALVLAITLLPALLAIFGRALFWPFIPRPGQEIPANRGWGRIARSVVRRPITVLVASAVALTVLTAGLLGTRVGLSQTDQFRVPAESVRGLEDLAEHFPAGSATPLTVLAPAENIEAVQGVASEEVAGVSSVQTSSAQGGVPQGGSSEGGSSTADSPEGGSREGESLEPVTQEIEGTTWARLEVTTQAEPASAESRAIVADLRERLAGSTDPQALVGGVEAEAYDQREAVLRDMALVIPLMLAMVLGVLIVILRSLVAPLVLVLVSIVGSMAALGAGAFVSRVVFDFPALDNAVPLYSFLFLVALGIDYTIFLVVRARQELLRGRAEDTASAMVMAVGLTGGVITSAGIVLAAVFVVLGVLPLITLTQIGIIVGLGILIDTFLVRTVVVPALFELIGDRVWWPSALARRRSASHSSDRPTPGERPQTGFRE